MPENVLFLEDLDVDRGTVRAMMAEAGLSHEPVWPGDSLPEPGSVGALVTVRAPVGRELLDGFPNVRIVAVAFTGYDVVDLGLCRERGIAVCNVPAYSTDSVAELTLGLTLALLRQIPEGDRHVRSGAWERREPFPPGIELAGKTVGIVGTGRTGLRAAELFHAFRCRLVAWSRTEREELRALGGTYLPLEEVFATADVISLHLPLNESTRGLVGESLLGRMKPGALLVNTARGAIVDSAALARVLQDGRIRAGLDVFEPEPLAAGDPLAAAGQTVLVPHVGFRTREALERRARITVENLLAFAEGRPVNRVA